LPFFLLPTPVGSNPKPEFDFSHHNSEPWYFPAAMDKARQSPQFLHKGFIIEQLKRAYTVRVLRQAHANAPGR